jgi:hypothetical protein
MTVDRRRMRRRGRLGGVEREARGEKIEENEPKA